MFEPRMLANGRICCSHEHALCDDCKAAAAANNCTPPDPYAAGLAKLRAANAKPEPCFAEQFKAARSRELLLEDTTLAQLRAAHEARLTAAELAEIPEAPDPYAAAIKALQLKGAR